MKKVSVIIPIYNMEQYLSECLDSMLQQTLGNDIELVCVNDGSPDNSLFVLRQYEAKYDNIIIINQMNSGVGVARNNGIKAASGEFVAFMDPDDYYLENDSLEVLYCAAKENNVKICGGSFSEDHETWIRKEWPGIYQKYTFREAGLVRYRNYQFDYGYHRFIYDREMLIENDIFFPPYIRFQDPPFFVKAMITADKFYAVEKITYCYRYGHQKLIWDERRVSHVLMGFIDNLRYSRENGLEELHKLTAWRMIKEYKTPIFMNIKSPVVLELLFQAQQQMNMEVLETDEELKNGAYSLIISALEEKELSAKKAEVKLRKADNKIKKIYASTTYKVGNFLLYIPKKLKKIIKGK